jgi:hypothetical protein
LADQHKPRRRARKFTYLAAALSPLFLVLAWMARGQNSAIAIPFATTPSLQAIFTVNLAKAATILARNLDGSYVQMSFQRNAPYYIDNGTSVMQYLAQGVGNLLAAPAGPPGVGLSAGLAGVGKFTTAGDFGIGVVSPLRNRNLVTVYQATLAGAYTGATTYNVGPQVNAVLAADFNGDGVADLAIPYSGATAQGAPPGAVGILINNGDGTFKPAVAVSAGIAPTGISGLDLNHDNILDLVVTDSSSSSVFVLLGKGDGTFNPAVPYATGTGSIAVTIADFNGDGIPDIAATAFDKTASILLGNGNGTFKPRTSFAIGQYARDIAAGDFNKDGELDLAVMNSADQTVSVFTGDGGGGFQAMSSYVTGYNAGSLVVTDYNGDGNLDILVGQGDARLITPDYDTQHIDFLLGRGDGTFQGLSTSGSRANGLTFIAAADFNGDGKIDVVSNQSLSTNLFFFAGGANSSFAATPTTLAVGPAADTYPSNAATGDFNGDGKPDLAVALGDVFSTAPGQVAIFLNNGSGLGAPSVFAATGIGTTGIAAADLDGDGKQDLAVTNQASGTTVVFHGGGNGAFQMSASFSTGKAPAEVIAADFNGDGKLDLAVADKGNENATPPVNGAIYYLQNNGNGGFQAPVLVSAGTGVYPKHLVAGDVNGDGSRDIIFDGDADNFGEKVGVLKGNGNGTFQAVTLMDTDFGPEDLAVRDFNGDGKADIVIAHCCGATDVTYFQGNGDGTFPAEVHFNGPASPFALAVMDINHDGAPDIVMGGNNGQVAALLNTATNFPCSYQLDKTALSPFQQGGTFTINVDTGPSCAWAVSGLPDWITVTSGASGTGSGTVTLNVASTAAARNATFSIAGISVNVTQALAPVCTYALNAAGQAFPAAGSIGSVAVTVSPGCAWSAVSSASFLNITSGASGSGNGTVSFTVASNSSIARSGTLTVAGLTFVIQQQASSIPGLNFIGSMPHIAAEENWTTTFTLVNKSGASQQARLSFFGDATDPTGNGALTLPLVFPQQSATSGAFLAASLDNTLNGNASLILNTAGPQTPPVLVGSAQLAATGAVDGFAIFRLIPGAQEAVVPMETRSAPSYLLAFDNTGGVVLGVAVENISTQSANINLIIRDDTGAIISSGTPLALAGSGHTSFVLSSQYPATAGKRGTIEFDTPAGGHISVLGIRTTPLGSSNTLTTIPALANVGNTGGSIAHIATGNGWQTTFVLVNTGGSSAPVHLSFFADNGSPLSLPLTFPQTGTTSTAALVNQTLAPGATLIVQSAAPLSDSAPTIGSAQLAPSGNVSGFVIFRYNPNGQEAVVPLESRAAGGYILAFDNTAGTATGVALNSVSSQAVNIPVVVRDDTGAQIATDTLSLAANGHLAFTLGTDKYPATAAIRGTIEFDTPAGAQIGALGIRIPVAHTFTTLPALAK